ncbi:uncharacterized protein LOC117328141 isoform X2 [Pecten maximus]|uniref:uncharacterized protein LOC117328141 isoform X2 n=1 Tax=Pecten maximus TaxID=6579 RepID=UPI001458333C|nr:uncharacterized protein LOC117328141 isoform X2 [Pecten maximus]
MCSSFESHYSVDVTSAVTQSELLSDNYYHESPVEVMPAETMTSHGGHDPMSMMGMPHPAMIGLPYNQASMVLAGYRDCAAQAISYLVEVEHMSIDDPFVVGLRNHLQDYQKSPDFGQLLRHQFDDMVTSPQHEHSLDDSGISESDNSFEHTHLTSLQTADITQFVSNGNTDNRSIDIGDGESLNLHALQNGSPAISALAQELLYLLEEEEEAEVMSESETEEDVIEQ